MRPSKRPSSDHVTFLLRGTVSFTLLLVASWFGTPGTQRAWAATIHVTPSDDYSLIEAARPGDEVVIAPGTYQYRLYLDQQATETQPIVIRAEDPDNKPVWDLGGQPVGDWPGSYSAGDKGRGAWQITGSHYVISGIVFQNCQDASSSGIRILGGSDITIRDCLFRHNTNGLIGSGENILVEFCEFDSNGKTASSGNMTHNIYIYGGTITIRYSYLHDSTEGQNFHIRARDATIEYNWITRPGSYPGDVMSCGSLCGGTGSDPITQNLTLRGNVIIQGHPENQSQIIALLNDDQGGSNDGTGAVGTMHLTMINNTIIGTPRNQGQTHVLVNMRNDTVQTYATLHNNIIVDIATLAAARQPDLKNWGVDGSTNWVTTGTDCSSADVCLPGSDPGFNDPTNLDFTLRADSACVDQADDSIQGLPQWEYYQNETVTRMRRPRNDAHDLGAFEQGNDSQAEGPYGGGPNPNPDGGLSDGSASNDGSTSDGSVSADAAQGDGAASADGGTSSDRSSSGCNCRSESSGSGLAWFLIILGLVGLIRRRRQK